MTTMAMSRRSLLAAGAGSLAVACGAAVQAQAPSPAAASGASAREGTVRRWYAAWDAKDWGTVDSLAADDFTFTSPAGDDHISKSTFKAQCWDTQSPLMAGFDLQSVIGNGNEVFVKYVLHTKQGKAIRNVERFTFEGDKIGALECYFGDEGGYPSRANKASG